MKSPKISQSLIKAYTDYREGKACGLQFKARYIDKDPRMESQPSEAMKAGIYFEYLCTGGLPKSGKIPVPEKAYEGTAKEKLAAPYERAMKSALLFKKTIAHYGIKIIERGLYLSNDEIEGTLDILAEWDGRVAIIDLKYSGLLDDKWHEMGWHKDTLQYRDSILIQGVHYKILVEDVLNKADVPFYFFVFDSTDPDNLRIIRENVDESKLASHRVIISNVKQMIASEIANNSFMALPTLKGCFNCPLKQTCSHATKVAVIEEINY